MRRPNFFIVGAPKCGTTALSEYLREHPQIFMSWPKEPGYFCADLHHWSLPWVRTEKAYLALFRKAGSETPVVGEATAGYILSRVAIPRILEFCPDAKMLLMLRNPIDLVYSLHGQLLWNLDEDVEDFQQAWNLQAERRFGHHLPSHCRVPEMLQYREVGLMAARVEELLDLVRGENLTIILLDDFARATGDVYREVLRFLGLPDDLRQEFPRANVSKKVRPGRAWLARINQRPSRFARGMAGLIKKLLGQRQRELLARLYRQDYSRPPLNPDFREELQKTFREDTEALAKLIDRDLSAWLV